MAGILFKTQTKRLDGAEVVPAILYIVQAGFPCFYSPILGLSHTLYFLSFIVQPAFIFDQLSDEQQLSRNMTVPETSFLWAAEGIFLVVFVSDHYPQ